MSRSGYDDWTSRAESERVATNRALAAEIRDSHNAARGRYGDPRVLAERRAHGRRIGRKRVARLIPRAGWSVGPWLTITAKSTRWPLSTWPTSAEYLSRVSPNTPSAGCDTQAMVTADGSTHMAWLTRSAARATAGKPRPSMASSRR